MANPDVASVVVVYDHHRVPAWFSTGRISRWRLAACRPRKSELSGSEGKPKGAALKKVIGLHTGSLGPYKKDSPPSAAPPVLEPSILSPNKPAS